MINLIQGVERYLGKVCCCAGDSCDQNDAVFVGNPSYRLYQFGGRLFAKATREKRTRFAVSHSPKRASSCRSNI